MKFVVLGGSGMLGSDLVAALKAKGYEVSAPSSAGVNITDPLSLASLASSLPEVDWVINCAAYTKVDLAETERQQAFELNTLAPGYLAQLCSASGVPLIHISTDFVFDGSADSPYDEDAPTKPIGYYGETKRDGEEAVLSRHQNAYIVRTSWLYGPNGPSFPKTMIRVWEQGKTLRVVADQTGCPTYTEDLAATLISLAEKRPLPGIYHAVGTDTMTWHEFALLALKARQDAVGGDFPIEIAPIPTTDYPTPAKRPAYSVLSTQKLKSAGIPEMPFAGMGLKRFVNRLPIEL